jgi:hypothetical protein
MADKASGDVRGSVLPQITETTPDPFADIRKFIKFKDAEELITNLIPSRNISP